MHSIVARLVPTGVASVLVGALIAAQPTFAVEPEEAPPPAATEATSAAPAWTEFERITLTKNVGEPMDLAVLPDLRVLHTSRNGDVMLTDPTTGITRVATHIPVYSGDEDGLQGIALGPDFEQNPWIYVYYSPPLDTPDGAAPETGPDSEWEQWQGHNLLSRFRWTGDALDLSTEQQILQVPTDRGACCHVGGDIEFDGDGLLYLSTGDDTIANGCPNVAGMAPMNDAQGVNPACDARRSSGSTDDLRGKILRIRVQEDGSYSIPEGNLFAPGTADTRPEIYVMGVRNPFRIEVDEETGALSWGDHGPGASAANPGRGPMGYAEWHVTYEAENAGWPYCHGGNSAYHKFDYTTLTSGEPYDCAAPVNDSRHNTGLAELPPAQPATLWYGDRVDHQPWPEFGAGGQSPVGGPVYHYDEALESDTKFPQWFDGKVFFGEFSRDYVKTFTLENDVVTSIDDFLPNNALAAQAMPLWDNPMELEFGPDGSLYALEYGDGFFRNNPDAGLYRIDHAPGNKTPTARISTDVTSGQGPLTVGFDAGGSTDPEAADLTYEWDFDGDGTFTGTGAQASHTYETDGQYQARLRVTDPEGKLGLASVTITVGNTAPTVRLLAPPEGGFFDFGDLVPFAVEVVDPEDGAIDCADVQWNYGLGHDHTHTHGISNGTGCVGVMTTGSASGHEDENIYGVVSATYTDRGAGSIPALTGTTNLVINTKELQAEHAEGITDADVVDDTTAHAGRRVDLAAGGALRYEPVNFQGITGVEVRAIASADVELSFRWNGVDGPEIASVDLAAGQDWALSAAEFGAVPTGTGALYVVGSGAVSVDELTFQGEGIVDTTGPVVTVDGVTAGSYGDSQVVTPVFSADDAGSGVASVIAVLDGEPVTSGGDVELWTLPLGEHELTVTATDVVGNSSTRSVAFTTTTSYADVHALIDRFVDDGSIPAARAGLLHSLLDQAQQHAAAGRDAQAARVLVRFENRTDHPVLLRDATALSAELDG